MSRVRADRYTNRAGTGSPTFSEGVNVVGISSLGITTVTGVGQTALTVNGDARITGVLTVGQGSVTIGSTNITTQFINDIQYPTTGSLSNRNIIINGAMVVAQRGTSESGLQNNPAYLVDRFAYRRIGDWGTNSFTMSQQSSGAPAGFTHFLRLEQSGTAAAVPGNTMCALSTYMERNTISRTSIGTSSAKPLTLSFYARASQAGTHCFSLQNENTDQSYVEEYSVTTSWQRFTINIPARTTGTWPISGNGLGYQMYWIVAADSDGDQSGSAGWTASNTRFTTNQSETFASTSGATFDLTGVQLEVGERSTPFEHRNYGEELALCQRYYKKYNNGSSDPILSYVQYSSVNRRFQVLHTPPMRDTPDVTISESGFTGITYRNTKDLFYRYIASAYDSGTSNYITNLEFEAEL